MKREQLPSRTSLLPVYLMLLQRGRRNKPYRWKKEKLVRKLSKWYERVIKQIKDSFYYVASDIRFDDIGLRYQTQQSLCEEELQHSRKIMKE